MILKFVVVNVGDNKREKDIYECAILKLYNKETFSQSSWWCWGA